MKIKHKKLSVINILNSAHNKTLKYKTNSRKK